MQEREREKRDSEGWTQRERDRKRERGRETERERDSGGENGGESKRKGVTMKSSAFGRFKGY